MGIKCFVYVCRSYVLCVYAGRFIPGTEDANLKGMQDDESLRTCTHSGVRHNASCRSTTAH